MTTQDIKSIEKILDRKLSPVKKQITKIGSDVSGLKTDVSELKADVAVLKADATELKSDMKIVKSDIQGIKNNSNEILDIVTYIASNAVSQDEFADHETRIRKLEQV